MAYCGSALGSLFGPAFAPVARRGREFGLAYAAAQSVHLGLVMWLFHISSRPPLSTRLIVFFSVGIFWTYLLAVFSFGNLAGALGPRGWRALRAAGMNYILLAFSFEPADAQFSILRLIEYVPFAAMSIAAPVFVFAASAHRRFGIGYSRARLGPVSN
jgi:hypothetical protein